MKRSDDDLGGLAQFVARLRRAREKQGLSIDDAAERSGLERSALARLERGDTANPTLRTLARYVNGLGFRFVLGMKRKP